MALLEIRIYDDPILRAVAEPIKEITADLRKLAADMLTTMYASEGIGLAANQIGSLQRIIVVDVEWPKSRERKKPRGADASTDGERASGAPVVMINPEVLDESVEDEEAEEGCLSIPDIRGDVWRPSRIRIRFSTLEGETIEREAAGLFARCVQHEIDHLNGIMFIDRMPKAARQALARPLARLAQSRQRPDEQAAS